MEFDATFIFAAFSFIVFVFLMNKIFYAPILKIMKDRQDFVSDNFTQAKNIKSEAEENIKYRENELQKSREEAQEIIAKHSQTMKQKCSSDVAEYKEKLFSNVSKEKEDLRNSAIQAKDILKDKVVDIAKNISSKILGSDIDASSINKSKIEEN